MGRPPWWELSKSLHFDQPFSCLHRLTKPPRSRKMLGPNSSTKMMRFPYYNERLLVKREGGGFLAPQRLLTRRGRGALAGRSSASHSPSAASSDAFEVPKSSPLTIDQKTFVVVRKTHHFSTGILTYYFSGSWWLGQAVQAWAGLPITGSLGSTMGVQAGSSMLDKGRPLDFIYFL